jgi:tetratricopeptide (TPR) repeat protein
MKRLLTPLLLSGLVGLAAGPAARADDEVRYYDRATKKEVTATGTIQAEKPSSITLKGRTATKEIPALDVLDVVYQVPALIRLDYKSAHNSESAAFTVTNTDDRKKALDSALKKYKDLLPKVTEEKSKRHFEFTIGRLLARQAEDDPSLQDPAMEKLVDFKKKNAGGWQLSACCRLLARLQLEKKDYDAAEKTYQELAGTPDLSREIRQECDLSIAQVLVAAKKYPDAEKKLQDLAKAVPADDPQASRVQAALAECLAATGKIDQAVPMLEGIIRQATDPDLKALAYNTLGDCYQLAKKPEDALWAYLWVDVLYHQNKKEHAKALYHLYKLFKERQDDPKAKQCREKLEKDKQFAGLEYQRLLEAEKDKEKEK